ncbi:hypothetical protein, partial [Allobacillus sp. SKP2-8]|uniref:hypothetical protein n=1 Tax=Allobacillus sp. SKP2-8 TaxID=1955271 RepID=UPI001642761C
MNSNIAIASAVTSYARIHMISYKTSNTFKCYYTDTDSVMIDSDLDSSLISNNLGMMKDELNGVRIKEAIFLGNKKYCYTFEEGGVLQTRSVFSGAPRNSLTMEDFKKMLKGEIVPITLKSQFVKTIRNLNVKIKEKVIRLR